MQDDFEDFLDILDKIDFTGKKVALFGLGDQSTYSSSFVDAMGVLYDWLKKKKVNLVGSVSTEGYTFENSLALRNSKLVGLALDEEYESHKSKERVNKWVEELKKEFKVIDTH